MAFSLSQPQTSRSKHMSKLTKGVGEFMDEEKRVEIVLDDKDREYADFNKYKNILTKNTHNSKNNMLTDRLLTSSKQEINLPKTYTTKKGALILFSEDVYEQKDEGKGIFDDDSFVQSQNFKTKQFIDPLVNESSTNFKTVNDLQKSVLNFGIPETQSTNAIPVKKDNSSQIKDFFMSTQKIEDRAKQIVKQSVPEKEDSDDEMKPARIQRGYSAKRYLNNLTRHWDKEVLDTFVTDGKIKNVDKPKTGHKRKISDYDLTHWPQAYRIDQNWASVAVDMKGYKFLKANEFNISTTRKYGHYDQKHEDYKNDHAMNQKFNHLDSYNSIEDDEKPYKPKKKRQADPIKIYDENSDEVSYRNLENDEKEKVLSQLLFHSAMNNILEMSDMKDAAISYSMDTEEEKDPRNKERNLKKLNELNSKSSMAFSRSREKNKTFDEQIVLPESATTRRSGNYNESDPIYMFGKYISAPLGKKPLPYIASEPNMATKSMIFEGPEAKIPATAREEIQPHVEDQASYASYQAPKLKEFQKKDYVTQFIPQLDLSNTSSHPKSYQNPFQKQISQNNNKIFNPLASSGSKSQTKNRFRKQTAKSINSSYKQSQYTTSHLTDITRKYENIIGDPDQENSSPTRLNFVLPKEKSNPNMILKEKSSHSQFNFQQEKSDLAMFEIENKNEALNKQMLHQPKIKTIRTKRDSNNDHNPRTSEMEYYGMPDDLDEMNKKKIDPASFDSQQNMMDPEETYKTPIEYYLEEQRSTREQSEFALTDSHSNSLISFDNEALDSARRAGKPIMQIETLNMGSVNRAQINDTASEKSFKSESINEPSNLKKAPLDDHLKLFKAKPRSKIDLSYSESVEEKLPMAQPKLMRQGKERVSLKEKMMQIKKKPNTLPPIESRMESATQRVTNQPSQILFEKENSGLNAKEKAMLDFDRENSESDFKNPINKLSVSIEEPSTQMGFKTERMAVQDEEISKPQFASYEDAPPVNKLAMPKPTFQDVLKPNINTDEVKKELTIEENPEITDEAPKVQAIKEEKPTEKREGKEAKKKLVYLDDDYARVDTMTIGKKPDRLDMIKKKATQDTKSAFNFKSSDPKDEENKPQRFTFQEWGTGSSLQLNGANTYQGYNNVSATKDDIVFSKPKMPPVTQRRKVDWSAGDFDPRECFILWSYETPPEPIVVDRAFANMLRRYAELLARTILGKRKGGMNLSEDIRRALRENLQKLMEQIAAGKISREVLEEYKNIFRKVLAKLLKRKDLEKVEITDEMLMKLLEHPPEAFEIHFDEATGKESLRIKSSYLRELAKLVRTIVTEVGLDIERDFEKYIDPITGEMKYRLKADVARKLGIPEGAEDMFEVYIDEHGNQQIRLKGGQKTITIGDTEYELVYDPVTGKQVLRMITKQKVGQETLEDILRLAANMTPNARHRYFQELLKTNLTMSDEMRRRIIEEMMKNAENLSPEARENLLKDLMTNLVNFLPKELAEKMLADIMKATEDLDPELKEKMIRNMLANLEDMPEGLRDAALKEIMKNMDNLTAEQKQKLLEDILTKVEELGITTKESQELKNQVLKEMLINAQNFDEETRQRIIQQVLAKATADGADVPQSILEELVKQMNSLPDEMKDLILNEVKKSLEAGTLDATVLAELLKNPANLSEDMLAAIAKNADKMDPKAMQELLKNLDKLPDSMKMDIINKMMEGGNMDAETMKELMRNMDKLPDDMKKEVLKKMMETMDSEGFQELMKNLDKLPDDLKRDVINKMFEKMDAAALGELVMNLDKLSDEMKAEVINKMLDNFDNLDNSVKQKLLKELLENPDLIQDKELRAKIIKDIMNNLTLEDVMREIEGMTPMEKHKYFQNLLKHAEDLPEELRTKIIEMMMKNAEFLDPETRDNLMKDFMANVVKYLPPDMQAKVLADLMKNTEHLDAETKKKMIAAMLDNMDDLPPELKQMALGELVKNLDDLSAEDKEKIFKDILAKVDDLPAEFRDKTLKAMVDNMGNFSAEFKNQMLQDILDKVEGGDSEFAKALRNDVIKEILANSQNLDEETRKKILRDVMEKLGDGEVPDVILAELVKQLDSLPDEFKQKVYQEIKNNIAKGNMDAKVLEELLKQGNLPPDILESLVANAANLNPEAYQALIKNLDKLPEHLKEKAIKDMLDNMKNLDPSVQRELLNELLKNPNLIKNKAEYEKAILGLMDNLEGMPENVRRDMMKNIAKNINNLSHEAKTKVLNEVFKNLENSSEETREEVLKQLLKNMGQKELEEWIKNSNLSEAEKAKMLASLNKLLDGDALLWDSDDERELEGLSPEARERKKKEIMERRRREREEGKGRWAESLRNPANVVKDANWLKKKQKDVLKNILGAKGPIENLSEDQMDFIKAFNKLSEEEKAKYLAGLTEEERNAILGLQKTYEALRLKELQDTVAQAKQQAIRKLREKLALKKKLDYMNMFRIEKGMFEHAAQLTRAFVFSYFEMLQWLDVSKPATDTENLPDVTDDI